jgi:hypothetical protein
MKKYTKADLSYQVASQEELADILAFLNNPEIPNDAIKFDLLSQSPESLIARDMAEMTERVTHATVGQLVF